MCFKGGYTYKAGRSNDLEELERTRKKVAPPPASHVQDVWEETGHCCSGKIRIQLEQRRWRKNLNKKMKYRRVFLMMGFFWISAGWHREVLKDWRGAMLEPWRTRPWVMKDDQGGLDIRDTKLFLMIVPRGGQCSVLITDFMEMVSLTICSSKKWEWWGAVWSR